MYTIQFACKVMYTVHGCTMWTHSRTFEKLNFEIVVNEIIDMNININTTFFGHGLNPVFKHWNSSINGTFS